MERLTNLYEEAKNETEQWKEKCAQLENEANEENEELRKQLNMLKRSSIVSDIKGLRL